MSEPKFTKGPWSAVENGFHKCAVKDSEGRWLTYEAGDSRRMEREEIEANAALMAASPDLFFALCDAQAWLTDSNSPRELRDRINAAIVKAFGARP